MSSQQALWTLAGNVSREMYGLTRAAVDPIIKELELGNGPYFFLLFTARALEPEPISAELFRIRTPYAHPSRWQTALAHLTERGLLALHGDNEYMLTQTGRDAIGRALNAFYQQLNAIQSSALESNAVQETAHDLKRIVDACLSTPELPYAHGLQLSHRVTPPANASALVHIDQAIDDLNAFRDDAHIAAFNAHDIGGQAWELFTFLWRAQVKNADEMAEKGSGRGYTRTDYMEALDELVKRRWVEHVGDGTYALTDAGRQVREEAEAQTDHYFYAPWANIFSAEQTAFLHDRLTGIENSLKHMAEAVPQ